MVDDEEIVGLERELSGEKSAVCDFCGRAVPQAALVRVGGQATVSEPVEVVHACDECRVRIDRDEILVDEVIADRLQVPED